MGEKEEKGYKQIGIYMGILASVVIAGILLCREIYIVVEKSFYEIGIVHELDAMSIMQAMGSELVDSKLREVKRAVERTAKDYAKILPAESQQKTEELLSNIKREKDSLGCCLWSEEAIIYGKQITSYDYIEQLDLKNVQAGGKTIVFDPDFDAQGKYVMAVATPVKWRDGTESVFVELFDGACVSEWIAPMSFSLKDLGIYNDLGACYIINDKGRNIAVAKKENFEWVSSRYSAWELAESVGDEESRSIMAIEQEIFWGKSGTGSYLWDGQTSYLAYGPITEARWGLGVGIYGSEFQKYTQEAIVESGKIGMVLMLGFTSFLGFIILFILRHLIKEHKYSEQLLGQKEELQEQALEIAASEERFRLAMQHTGDMIVESQLEDESLITYRFGDRIAYASVSDERVKKELLDGAEMDDKSFHALVEVFRSVRNGLSGAECTMRTVHGGKKYSISVSTVTDVNGNPVRAVGLIKDVTKEHKGELDSLTELLNKAAMTKALTEELEKSGREDRGAFCMVDIDRFKQVNDTYGHPVGDAVILKIADVLRTNFPEPYLLGRLGGDEFCILCPPEAGTDMLPEKVDELRRQIRELSIPECRTPGISCSCGVVFYTGEAAYEEIYKQADRLLYEVKENGRDGCRYSEFKKC